MSSTEQSVRTGTSIRAWLIWGGCALPPLTLELIAWRWNGLYRRFEGNVQDHIFGVTFTAAPWYWRDDHYFHVIIAGWMVLWLAWGLSRLGWHWRWAAVAVAVVCALDEGSQAFDPERSSDVVDLLSGWTGVAVVSILLGWRTGWSSATRRPPG